MNIIFELLKTIFMALGMVIASGAVFISIIIPEIACLIYLNHQNPLGENVNSVIISCMAIFATLLTFAVFNNLLSNKKSSK